MKVAVTEALMRYGVFVGHTSKVENVWELVRRMCPVTTEKELIRLGDMQDGGYLVPNDLDGIAACFSPGVSNTATFEAALIARGIPCYLADASVAKAPIDDPLIHFLPKYLGVVSDDMTIPLDNWVSENAPPDGDLLLQMDIEGAEWPVLLNVSEQTLSRFRIVVLELHSMDRLGDQFGYPLLSSVLDRLLRHYHVVHIHPNNVARVVSVGGIPIPKLLEITFLRRDRATVTGYQSLFPHPLDCKNVADKADISLGSAWRGG